MTATVEGFEAAYKRGDLSECERLAVELERAGGLAHPMLTELGAAHASLGDAEAILRLHRRARLLSDYEQALWEVFTIRLRCNLGDLEGGMSHLRLMREQQIPISAAAAAPIFAGSARSRRPATAVQCLELLAAWAVKLDDHTMNLAVEALAGVDEIPEAGRRLQSIHMFPRLAQLSRSKSHTAMWDALRVDDHDGAARLLRRALDGGDGVDYGLIEKIKARLGPADRAELEFREVLNEIARGRKPGAKLTAVLVNLATADDTDSIERLFESVRAKGLPIGPRHIACTMKAATRARDPELACRALELMHGSGIPFAADGQRGLLTACRTPADAPRAHELLLGFSEHAQTVSETLALLSIMIDDSRETTESALAAARSMTRDGRRLTAPYWEALLDRAPADTAPMLVESLTRALNAGRNASAFCTDVLRLLASTGDVALVDDVFAAMVDNGVSVNERHLCALLHPLADAEAHEALRAVAHIVVERGLTLDTTAQNALLRGLRRDPGDTLTFLRDNAVVIGIRSSTIDARRIDWLIEHDDMEAAGELARGLRDDDAAHAHLALLNYHSHIGDAAATAQQLEALIAALQPPPDPYDVSRAFELAAGALGADRLLASLDHYERRFGPADSYTYGHVLTRLARLGEADLALALHQRLVIVGFELNSYHDAPVLAALASGGRIGEVLAFLQQVHESGRPPLPVVGMRLVEKASDAAQARMFVDACAELDLVPDLPLQGALLKRYADEGDIEGAETIYRDLTVAGHEPDDRIFACMIRAHAEAGDLAAARRWLDDARRFGITPNGHHYAQVMVAARGNADELAEILRDMVRHGESPTSHWHWRVMSSAPGAADAAKALWREFVQGGSATPELAEGALEVLATSQDADGARVVLDWLVARGDANGSHYLAAMHAAVERPGAVPRLMQELEGAGLELEPDHYLAALEAATKVNDAQSVDEVLASLDFRAADPHRASLGALALGRSGNVCALEQLIADAAEEIPSDYWQALIVAYGISRQLDKAMSAYRRALSSTTAVYSHVYRAIIEACSDLGRPDLTDGVLDDALRVDLDTESLVVLHNLAIRSYSRAQRVTDCERIKLLMEERGLPVDRYTLGPIQSALERMGALRDVRRRLHTADSERFRELGVILSDVVHELHQPVGIIGPAAGRARRALSDGRLDDARDAIDRLVDVSQEIADRINTYMQLTEGSEGDRTFDLRHAIEVAVCSVQQFADRSDVRLIREDHVERHADILMRGNQFVVQLAIRGLLMNAIQAIAGATERLERRQVAVRLLFTRDAAPADQRAGWADILVSDTGPGIPEEIRAHIFERGFTTKSNRGLGLGLGMVQSAAESHGGYATHLEEVTQGAELWLRLPIVESGESDRP